MEYGNNTCGITSMVCYTSTTVHNSSAPIAPPTRRPLVSISPSPRPLTGRPVSPNPTTVPVPTTATPTVIPVTSRPSAVPVTFKPTYVPSGVPKSIKTLQERAPALSMSIGSGAEGEQKGTHGQPSGLRSHHKSVIGFQYYSYLNAFIPPNLQVGSPPVVYYGSNVQHYYSPKPSSRNYRFIYYGTPEPTLTIRPTTKSLGQFGYSSTSASAPQPTKMPLVYYGDFKFIHTPTKTPTLLPTSTSPPPH